MPLDTGGLSDMNAPAGDDLSPAPTIHSGGHVGDALRMLREMRGMPLDDLSERTRVRASFLAALEDMRLEVLPSRPFVIGYIRAYAQAVGADAEAAVQRFKTEEPVLDEPLAAPVGVQDERDPRLGAILVGAAIIVVAIIAWNVVQRIMTETAPTPPTASETVAQKALANTMAGPVALGAPLPAPVESTTPPPYQTPGLDKAVNAQGQPLAPPVTAQPQPEPLLPQAFTPKGQVFGAPAAHGAVVLQALKPAFLVVRGGDGAIYFARQLAEGEAYRAPAIGGLTVDVSEPEAFQVFAYGQSRGVLPQPLSDLGKLAGPAPAAPKPAAVAPPKPATATAGAPTPAPSPTAAKPPPPKPAAATPAGAGPKSVAPRPAAEAAPAKPKPAAPHSAETPKPAAGEQPPF